MVDHVTVYRWVQRFTAGAHRGCPAVPDAPGDRWFVDETYMKVARRWTYLYRAVDQHGQVIDVLLSVRRDLAAARRFFTRALRAGHGPGRGHDRPRARLPAGARRAGSLSAAYRRAVREQPDRSRPRATESPAPADARTEAPPVRADPRRRSRVRAEPPPRPLRHRRRSPQPATGSASPSTTSRSPSEPARHPASCSGVYREGTTQQRPAQRVRGVVLRKAVQHPGTATGTYPGVSRGTSTDCRTLAELGIRWDSLGLASIWGSRGRGFKSRRPDWSEGFRTPLFDLREPTGEPMELWFPVGPGLRGLRGLGLENPVHGRRALGERGPYFVTVHGLGDRCAAVPDQVADVFEPDIVRTEDGHERVP